MQESAGVLCPLAAELGPALFVREPDIGIEIGVGLGIGVGIGIGIGIGQGAAVATKRISSARLPNAARCPPSAAARRS